MAITLKDLGEALGVAWEGPADLQISSVGALDSAGPQALAFLANPKYRQQLETTRAGAVILSADVPYSRPRLISANPYRDFTRAVKLFAPAVPLPPAGVHPLAWVHPGAKLGPDVAVGPFCVVSDGAVVGERTVLAAQVFIGERSSLGEDCILYPGVVVRERVQIGKRVIIHPNAVLGADGFGFAPDSGHYQKIPQIGIVVIEDDVEIGANTTIDRAALGETRVGCGSKLDNLVMVAHNVTIGPDTVIAAQAGISGSAHIGSQVMIGGQAGLQGHIRIGDRAILGAQAGVTKGVAPGEFVSGYPARAHKESMRQLAEIARLPELSKRVRALEKRLAELEAKERL
jgi:UDP-3-O-[3-hydroxymyristoyl] glucosamine N-acyltransferase